MNDYLSTRLAAARALRLQISQHWNGSPAQRWLDLWITELRDMLPERLRARLAARQVPRIAWPLPENVDTHVPYRLVLGASEVLIQRLTLPQAATRDLPRMLGYEIDKYTPFARDEVHFAARVEQVVAGRARVLLVSIARNRLDPILQQCAEQNLTLAGIEVLDHDRQPLGIELLPEALRTGRRRHSRLERYLAWGCAALLVSVMLLFVHAHQATVEQMRAEVETQREQVLQVKELRQELANTRGAASYLTQLRAARPTVSALLAELTACIGDDTWIEQLETGERGELSFSGQSRQASALIGRMKHCPSLDNVQFQGVIQPDAQTGKDRFSLQARLRAPLKETAEDASTIDPS